MKANVHIKIILGWRSLENMKVCLVGSSGHLTHLYMLKLFWKDKEHFWVTFDKEDARSLLEGEKYIHVIIQQTGSLKALIKIQRLPGMFCIKRNQINYFLWCSCCSPVFFILLKWWVKVGLHEASLIELINRQWQERWFTQLWTSLLCSGKSRKGLSESG